MVAALIAAWMALVVVVIGAHDDATGGLLHSRVGVQLRSLASTASRSGGPGLQADAAHVDRGSPVDDHEPMMATASLQSSAPVVAGGVAAVHVPVAGLLAGAAAVVGGRSCGSAMVLAGQDRLTRLCMSRR